MPVKLVTPIELVAKESILINEYETTAIFINLSDSPYVRVEYVAKNDGGATTGTAQAILDSTETAQFILDNPIFYTAIKKASYDAGKVKGVIPSDAGII